MGPPYKQNEEKKHIWSVGYQNRVKMVCRVGFKVFEKGQIFMPFSGLAPSKLKMFPKKNQG